MNTFMRFTHFNALVKKVTSKNGRTEVPDLNTSLA